MTDILAQYGTLIYLLVIVVFFYLFLIRPQQKQHKQRLAMLNNLKKGDKIVNHGGVIGTIVDVRDDKITVRIADKVEVNMLKEGVAKVLGK